MQLSVDISVSKLLSLISQMSLSEVEELKDKLVERELYFKRFEKKDDVENIVEEFREEGYSEGFLKDLENGLRRSSYSIPIASFASSLILS